MVITVITISTEATCVLRIAEDSQRIRLSGGQSGWKARSGLWAAAKLTLHCSGYPDDKQPAPHRTSPFHEAILPDSRRDPCSDVFADFLDLAVCAIRKKTLPPGAAADALEERYMAAVKRNEPEDVRKLPLHQRDGQLQKHKFQLPSEPCFFPSKVVFLLPAT